MKKARAFLIFLLVFSLCLALCACGRGESGYKTIAELNTEEFRVAFRKDDPMLDIVTAALKEIAAEGSLSRLSSQYLGADYSCMEALPGALKTIDASPGSQRVLLVGVQDGIAPLCSARDDGSFTGLIPDLVQLVMEKLGWTYRYIGISSDSVNVELASGNVDCAFLPAALDSAAKEYSLTPGWLSNSHLLVVRNGSGYNRLKSLKGRVLGIVDPTSKAALDASWLKDKAGAVWNYDDLRSCFNALAVGNCDGIVIDSVVASYYM